MSKSPTAVLNVAGVDRQIRFGFARLDAIERATGMTVPQVWAEMLGCFQAVAGKKIEDITDEERSSVAKRLRLGLVSGFIAGCLDTTIEKLDEMLELPEVMGAFAVLLPTFTEAMTKLGGGAEGNAPAPPGEEPPPAASTASTPGPASSSASAPTS